MSSLSSLEPATVIGISIAAFTIVVTGFSIYTAFGPPSTELGDPFEDHED
jgi:PsbN protein